MFSKSSINFILFFFFIGALNAQDKLDKRKQLPSVALGVGVTSFDGDIGGGVDVSSFGRIRSAYNLTVEQRIKNIIGISFSGTYGKIADSENGKIGGLNFESEFTQLDLNLVLHFDNDIILKRDIEFAPYITGGIGFLKFNPHADLKDRFGTTYHYWSDGTIRDTDESDPAAFAASLIERDYKYETKLFDSTTNYARTSLAFPVGFGISFKLSNALALNIAGTYYFTQTDWIDNKKLADNDAYLFACASIKYSIGANKLEDNSSAIYKSIDFSTVDKLDTDGDGIADANDKCAGTPKGVKIDSKGCPLDSDEDGVADYLDKEPQTKKGDLVDGAGVTINEQQIAQKQIMWDSIATDRNQVFNDNPSLGFLKKVESSNIKNPTKAGNIPLALKPADIDGNGYISSSEIINALDGFFEGESKFTVALLNDLIDYFFEQ